HAALFLLACDAGVTQSDADVWNRHLAVSPNRHASRLVVLNKIDALWDDLRSDAEISAEIETQRLHTAITLGLPPSRVLAASAQKALTAKIKGDDALLARSRLPELERRLADELIPGRQNIMREAVRSDLEDLLAGTRGILNSRLQAVQEQIAELGSLRGRNLDVVEGMMARVRGDKESFEKTLRRFQAVRRIFVQHTDTLFISLGMDAIVEEGRQVLKKMRQTMFSAGLSAAMNEYFDAVRGKLSSAEEKVIDIQSMMEAMYRKFSEEHGLQLNTPMSFSMLRYQKEFDRLERNFHTHFDTAVTMLTTEKLTLMQKFFETLVSQVRRLYEFANRDVDAWLRAILAPMETQVHERQLQLRRRLDSIKRIHRATDQLEARITELEQMQSDLGAQMAAIGCIAGDMTRVLETQEMPLAFAA
ncbi:MAG TPA: GTPase, partial [Burkholderiales bacterium]|nr:GTPase [Burkholderiales bacterium]